MISLLCHGVAVLIPEPHETTLWNSAKGIRLDLGVTCRGARAFKLEDYVDVEMAGRGCVCVVFRDGLGYMCMLLRNVRVDEVMSMCVRRFWAFIAQFVTA